MFVKIEGNGNLLCNKMKLLSLGSYLSRMANGLVILHISIFEGLVSEVNEKSAVVTALFHPNSFE
ncbi:hypothetical protein CN354_15375 [Bacillus cereus]|nr:hypothetical protein CN354_15375 [Bacillus cereus]